MVLLQKLETAAAAVGLTINQSKTKAMIIGDKSTGEQISLKTGDIEIVDNFCYLGSWIAMSSKDIIIRKAQAWTAINKLSKIWKAIQLSRELKIRFLSHCRSHIAYYFMAVNAGLLQLHKNVLLMGPTPVCSAKLLTFRTKTTFQILLYMVLCHQSAQHSVPDYSLQGIVSEE